jgi:DNA-binding MarR family transcriptional regulator
MSNPESVSYVTTIYVRDHCLCLHTQRAARSLARIFDEALRPSGLTNGQFSLLMALNRPFPAGMKGLATLLAMDRTTLTAALKPLERRGWIGISVDPKDKRGRLLRLTPEGQRVLASAVPIWERTHEGVERQLPGGNADRLRRDLSSVVGDLHAGQTLVDFHDR